jgi:hypothetical protein
VFLIKVEKTIMVVKQYVVLRVAQDSLLSNERVPTTMSVARSALKERVRNMSCKMSVTCYFF